MGSVCIIETFCSSWCTISALLVLRIVPSSWNNYVGIGPIGKDKTLTFGEMALDFVKNQISCFQFTSVVVDIFDRYDIQNSVKKAERDRRSKLFSLHLIKGRVIPDCLYYRNVLFQLMYNISLTGFAHCAIVVKQLCWNRTNWKRQNLFNSNVLSTICKNQFPTFTSC
jgi:hypothetical protein